MAQFTDDFNRSDNDNIATGSSVPWTETDFSGTGSETAFEIVSNTLRLTENYYANAIAGDAGDVDHWAECVVSNLDGSTEIAGPIVRGNSGNTQGYWAAAWDDRIRLYRGNGSATPSFLADSGTLTLTGTHTIRLEAVGSNLEVFVDDVSELTYDVTSAGDYTGQYIGIGANGATDDTPTMDSFDGGSFLEEKNGGTLSSTNGDQSTMGTASKTIILTSSDGDQSTMGTASSTRNGGTLSSSNGVGGSESWSADWQIPPIVYTTEFVSPGALSLEPSLKGGTMISAIRVLSAANRAVYSSIDEEGVTKLPMKVGMVSDLAEGIVTRSASNLVVWLEADPGMVPEHAPVDPSHPFNSWSGARVEIYVGWRIGTVDTYTRRATLAVGRCAWDLLDEGHRVTVNLIDLRQLLDQDLDEDYVVTSGELIADVLEDLVVGRFGIEQRVEKNQGFQDACPDLTYEAKKTSRLDIIRDLEDGSGLGVSFDREGVCRIGPQLDVEVRSEPRIKFGDSAATEHIFKPPARRLGGAGAPSGVELTVEAPNDEEEETIYSAYDSDPLSFTYWNEGDPLIGDFAPIVETTTSEIVDSAEQGARAAWALLRKHGRGGPGGVLEFESIPIPGLLGGDPIRISSQAYGLDGALYTVLEVNCPLDVSAMMTITARPSWDPTNGAGDNA